MYVKEKFCKYEGLIFIISPSHVYIILNNYL